MNGRNTRFALIILTLTLICFSSGAMASKKQWKIPLYDNFSYDIPGEALLTEKMVLDSSYKVHVYGSMMEGNYVENPPYSMVAFKDGKGALQDANIQSLVVGKTGALAAFELSSFDGGNRGEAHLCILTPKNGSYHVNQVLIDPSSLSLGDLRIEKGVVVMDFLYPGPNDPACCPTLKGTARFKVEKDKIVELP